MFADIWYRLVWILPSKKMEENTNARCEGVPTQMTCLKLETCNRKVREMVLISTAAKLFFRFVCNKFYSWSQLHVIIDISKLVENVTDQEDSMQWKDITDRAANTAFFAELLRGNNFY